MNLNKLNDAERLAVTLITLTPYGDLDAAYEAVLDRLQDELAVHASETGATLEADYCPEEYYDGFMEQVSRKHFANGNQV